MVTVITFGTFDLFHIGHLNLLRRASKYGDRLIVGVSSDKLNFEKKGKEAVYNENIRLDIISSLKFVTSCFLEESLELKKEYILEYGADVLVMGNDWSGKFDYLKDVCRVIYLSRTPSVSTTDLIEYIRCSGDEDGVECK